MDEVQTVKMVDGGKLRKEYSQVWADYFVKYIEAYRSAGIPIWGITVQNEAMASQVWESCVYTAEEERDFVRDYLGPALGMKGMSDVKIMDLGSQPRDHVPESPELPMETLKLQNISGELLFIGTTGGHFDNVRMVHDAFPDKKLLYTEAGLEVPGHRPSFLRGI